MALATPSPPHPTKNRRSHAEDILTLFLHPASADAQSSLVKNRRKVLADLREKNKSLEDLVGVVKDSVLDTFGGEGPDDEAASPKAFLEGTFFTSSHVGLGVVLG